MFLFWRVNENDIYIKYIHGTETHTHIDQTDTHRQSERDQHIDTDEHKGASYRRKVRARKI